MIANRIAAIAAAAKRERAEAQGRPAMICAVALPRRMHADVKALSRAALVLLLLAMAATQLNWRQVRAENTQMRFAVAMVEPAAALEPKPAKIENRIEPMRMRAVPAGAEITSSYFEDVSEPRAAAHEDRRTTETFRTVEVIDARTLRIGELTLKLDAAKLPARDSLCRRLDGKVEFCWERAATQLELATRFRPVICNYAKTGGQVAQAECNVSGNDLALLAARLKQV